MRQKIPRSIALLVMGIGLMDIVSSIVPAALDRWHIVRDILPIEIIHTSRTLTLIGGIFLLTLGRALWQQKKRAWSLALATIFITLFAHLSKGLDIEETLTSLVVISLLWYFRSLYYVESNRTSYRLAIFRSAIIILIFYLYKLGGSSILHLSTRYAHWFENSIFLINVAAILSAIATLFEPAFDKHLPTTEEKNNLLSLLSQATSPSSYFALMDDKSLWFDESHSHALAYKKIGKFAVILGEPIGRENQLSSAQEFQEHILKQGGEIVWTNMSSTNLASQLELIPIKIGEDAVIDIDHFSLDGSEHKDIRNAATRVSKLNLHYFWHNMESIPWADLKLVDDLYTEWTSDKSIPVLTFSLGFYPFPIIQAGLILLVKDSRGSLLAALSFFPYLSGQAYCLDLMLRSQNSGNGIMESAIVHAIEHFKTIGIQQLNLGMAPLSNIEFMGQNKIVKTIRNLLLSQFNKFYKYKSLFSFKAKFYPRWESQYIYLKSIASLPAALVALAAAHRK